MNIFFKRFSTQMGSGNIKESRHTNGKICGNETRLQMIISSGRKGSHVNTIIPARAAMKPYRVTDCKEKAYMLQEGAVYWQMRNHNSIKTAFVYIQSYAGPTREYWMDLSGDQPRDIGCVDWNVFTVSYNFAHASVFFSSISSLSQQLDFPHNVPINLLISKH